MNNITVEQAISCLNEGEQIHVFMNAAFGLIGADWERQDILDLFAKADKIEIGGKQCRAIKHGIVVFPPNAKYQSDLHFVECDDEKLGKLLGEITNND